MAASKTDQNIITHIGFVLDRSASMRPVMSALIKVIDNQIRYLAQRSKELNQETRVSIWTFDDNVECLIWDMDVLRVPSIEKLYVIGGWTALRDGTMTAVRDLKEIPERYGDHSVLLYVATDGEENRSVLYSAQKMIDTLSSLPDNWTVAALVPDAHGVHDAKKLGFPAGNVQIWDATTTRGVESAGESIKTATDKYMQSRATGTRSTTTLFSTGNDAVNARTVKAAKLTPLDPSDFVLTVIPPEHHDAAIRPYICNVLGLRFVTGRNFYELIKTEEIQPQKAIAVWERKTGQVYIGQQARTLIGLSDVTVRVPPDKNDKYGILVQSTSVNRKLKVGQRLLVLNKNLV